MVGRGGVCGQNLSCYHVAALEIILNLIYNTTVFLKKLNFDQLSPPLGFGGSGGGGGVASKIFVTMLLHI